MLLVESRGRPPCDVCSLAVAFWRPNVGFLARLVYDLAPPRPAAGLHPSLSYSEKRRHRQLNLCSSVPCPGLAIIFLPLGYRSKRPTPCICRTSVAVPRSSWYPARTPLLWVPASGAPSGRIHVWLASSPLFLGQPKCVVLNLLRDDRSPGTHLPGLGASVHGFLP